MKKAIKIILSIVGALAFFGLTAEATQPIYQLPFTIGCFGVMYGSFKGIELLDKKNNE